MCISNLIQWGIHSLSNAFSKHIQLVIHAYPTWYPCAYPVYPMGYPLFIQRILQAYPNGHPWLSNRLSKHIQTDIPFIQLDIWLDNWSDLRPGHPGGFLHCHPNLHSGTRSCIICCFRWAAIALNERGASVTRVHIQPALLHQAGPLCCCRHCCTSATNAAKQAAASFRCSRHGFVTLLIHE